MSLLLIGFVAGYISHLAVDGLMHEGVPLLFPWGFHFGLPPWSRWRVWIASCEKRREAREEPRAERSTPDSATARGAAGP